MILINGPFDLVRFKRILGQWEGFKDGLIITVQVAVCGLLLALLLGIIFGLCSTSKSRVLKGIARMYVEFFQNTPLVVQVFFMYYPLAMAGVVLEPFTIGILGVGIYHGAYVAEVIRAGIQSIPDGQLEAAASQGFTYLQTMQYIILPQTVKIILPPLTNQAVNLIKNTSVLSMISGFDLMYVAESYASYTLDYAPSYILAGLLYFILCFPLASFARRYEEKLKKQDYRTVNEIELNLEGSD